MSVRQQAIGFALALLASAIEGVQNNTIEDESFELHEDQEVIELGARLALDAVALAVFSNGAGEVHVAHSTKRGEADGGIRARSWPPSDAIEGFSSALRHSAHKVITAIDEDIKDDPLGALLVVSGLMGVADDKVATIGAQIAKACRTSGALEVFRKNALESMPCPPIEGAREVK